MCVHSSLHLHMNYLFCSYFLQVLLNWWRDLQVSTNQGLESTTIFEQVLGYGYALTSYDHITEYFMMRCMEGRGFQPSGTYSKTVCFEHEQLS